MKTRLFTLAALAAIAVSCSNEDEIAPKNNLKDTPITVTAGVEQLSTRAGYEGTTTLPTTFYLTLDQDGDAKYDYTDVAMTNNGSGTTLIDDVERVFKATASAPSGFVSANAYTVSLALGEEKVDAVAAQSTAWVDEYDTLQDIETH